MGRLITLLAANRDVKIQECGILQGEDRFPIAVHGEYLMGLMRRRANFRNSRMRLRAEKTVGAASPSCRKAKRILLLNRGFVGSIKATVSPHNPRKRPLASYNVGYCDSYPP